MKILSTRARKALALLGVIAAAAAVLAGCTHNQSAQQKEQAAQQGDTQSLEQNQPLPHYNYSQIRQTEIDAQNIEANGTQTVTFFFNYGQQDPFFTCPSLGEPISAAAQLSDPEQIAPISSRYGGGATNLPQMDPNGIYSPTTAEGTYVICVNSSGQKYLQYDEGPVATVSAGATWDYASTTWWSTARPPPRSTTGPASSGDPRPSPAAAGAAL